MLGCDFHCGYCQNWVTSQAGRDPQVEIIPAMYSGSAARAGRLRRAQRRQAVVSSYNEPLITSEWAAGVFRAARQAGLRCAYVSNGNATDQR
jgi:pyruvate formate lyase activating enzyme